MTELEEIGAKINDAMKAVWSTGLKMKELEKLEALLNHIEKAPASLNQFFQQIYGFQVTVAGHLIFKQTKERIKLLKPIIRLKPSEIKEVKRPQ